MELKEEQMKFLDIYNDLIHKNRLNGVAFNQINNLPNQQLFN